MRTLRPKLNHPPDVYVAIVKEHGAQPVRMAQTLQSLGWTLADAAWAAVNWTPEWLAAAIATEKQGRGIKLHSLSDDAVAILRAKPSSAKPPALVKPCQTTRIIHPIPKDK